MINFVRISARGSGAIQFSTAPAPAEKKGGLQFLRRNLNRSSLLQPVIIHFCPFSKLSPLSRENQWTSLWSGWTQIVVSCKNCMSSILPSPWII